MGICFHVAAADLDGPPDEADDDTESEMERRRVAGDTPHGTEAP